MKKLLKLILLLIAILLMTNNLVACSVADGNLNSSGNSGNSSNDVWQINYYVDEFNNPTNDAYITNKKAFSGTFSNSATTNSKLDARILIDKNGISIKLYEYGTLEVKAYSTETYNIIFLEENGNKHNSIGIMYENGDRIKLTDNLLMTLINSNKTIKVHIEEVPKYGGYRSTYLFDMKIDNLPSVYSEF